MKTPKKFVGKWRILETTQWDRDALDLVVPAYIQFDSNGLGHFQMIAVDGELDCRFDGDRVEFSWIGEDEGDAANGRGWAELTGKDRLEGMIYFHLGDDSGFIARRARSK